MKTRKLGNEGLVVPAIGLGCMVMPGFYRPGDEDQSVATLHRAAEIGINHLDSSDLYGAGKNEELIGRAIRGRRQDYILATKFGNTRDAEGNPTVRGDPDYVQQACEASLKRLGVDEVDLYYQHRVDPTVPIEETVGAMARLVEQGKTKYLGLSEAGPETIRRAHAVHPISALQTEYSLWSRDAEEDLLPLCAELGIGYVAYSPLGRGIFTGEITGADSLSENDRRRDHPRFQGDNLDDNIKLAQPVIDLAEDKGVTPSQIALAWVLARGEQIVPIPGTRRSDHLESNAAAMDIDLGAEDVARLDQALAMGAASGTRYPAGGMKWLKL
jgi:aryl-alcohol dehydrogenase-like predicted oxidoreductase